MTDQPEGDELLRAAVDCLETKRTSEADRDIKRIAEAYRFSKGVVVQRPSELRENLRNAAVAVEQAREALDRAGYFDWNALVRFPVDKFADGDELKQFLLNIEKDLGVAENSLRKDRGAPAKAREDRELVADCLEIFAEYSERAPTTTADGPFVQFVNDVAAYATGRERDFTDIVKEVRRLLNGLEVKGKTRQKS